MTPKLKVLVVEDDPALLRGLLDFLVFNGFSAEGADDGGTGCRKALDGDHDLILLDVMLPIMDGFSICREVRRAKPHQPIIMLTAKGSEDDIVTGFKSGADDYVSKPFSLRELMVRVQAVLRRSGRTLAAEKVEFGGVVFDAGALTAVGRDQMVELTRREVEIVLFLFQHKDRIVSKTELLSQVWNYSDPEVETRTVDIHMAKLRRKLSVFGENAPAIQTVRGEGYRLTVGS